MKKLNYKSKTFKYLFTLSVLFLITGAVTTYILLSQPKTYTLDQPQTYDYEGQIITQDIHITVDGVILKNATIEGDIYIEDSVGEGHIELENITAKGKTYIYGGGKDTLMVIGGQIYEALGEFNGRIHAINWATMDRIEVKTDDIIIQTDDTSRIKSVELLVPEYNSEQDKPVELNGNIDEVKDNGQADVNIKEGTRIKKYIPSCLGSGCEYTKNKNRVNMEKDSNIEQATVSNPTEFTGEGTIDEIDIQSDDVTVDVETQTTTNDNNYDVQTSSPKFNSNPKRTSVNTNTGDYTLVFNVNSKGTIYYIFQPPTDFTIATPTVTQVKNGEGNSACSTNEQFDCPPNVVSSKTITVTQPNTDITVNGYYGDNQGMRPEGMDDFDPSSTLFSVFENEDGEVTEVVRVEF